MSMKYRMKFPETRYPIPRRRRSGYGAPARLKRYCAEAASRTETRLAAFTLIEVMVVIIIISIMAGAVIPNLGGSMGTVRLKAGAREIADLMDFCYQSAVASGRVHALVFEEDGRRYEVVAERPDETGSFNPDAPPMLDPVSLPGNFDRTLPEEIAIHSMYVFETDLVRDEEGRLRVLFFPDGTTEFATLYLEDASGRRQSVEINGMSGEIRVGPAEPPGASEGDEEDESEGEDE